MPENLQTPSSPDHATFQPLAVNSLTTGYKTRNNLKRVSCNLSARVPPGRLTCLLGPNGAGKSTLLKTMAGFLNPLAGTVLVGETPLQEIPPGKLAATVGVVLTDRPDLPNTTVGQLAALGRSPHTGFWGRLSHVDSQAVGKALELAGISHLAERPLNSLSDGERQKAMIAKVLAQDTPIVLLDEPTAFLDYPSKIEIMRILRSLARGWGKTVFLSTHDLEIALQVADNLWLLDSRLGLSDGSPEELSRNGTVAKYFDRPGVVFQPSGRSFKII